MSGKRRLRRWVGPTLFALAAGAVLAFQNCAAPMQGSLFDKVELESLAKQAPFAFDATLDQIAYMSCSEMGAAYDPGVFFSVRAGAYQTGGVRLSDSFRTYLKVLNPQDDPAELMSLSPISGNVAPQLDIRPRASLSSRSLIANGVDVGYLMHPLTNEAVARPLLAASAGQRIRMIAAPGFAPLRFETTLNFNVSDEAAAAIRGNLANTHYISLVFAENDGKGNMPPVSPYDDPAIPSTQRSKFTRAQTLFGRGYGLSFATPSPSDFGQAGGPSASLGSRVLSSIAEVNLNKITLEGDGASNWTCLSTRRFKIVRPEDAAAVGCARTGDPSPMSSELALVRHVLPEANWYVDMSNRCIVQKNTGAGACYGATTTKVQYNLAGACSPIDTTNGKCAHFLSICVR